VAGIALVRSRRRSKAAAALWLLLVASSIDMIWRIINLVQSGGEVGLHYWFPPFLLSLAVGSLAAMLLFAPRDTNLVRISSLATIAMAAIMLLLNVWTIVVTGNSLADIFNLLSLIAFPTYIVLGWTFFSKTEEPAPILTADTK
jgi:peptidoglycan/LPS O-acetylase OafA/YrhL